MRTDMKRVLIQRPRAGGHASAFPRHVESRTDPDLLPQTQGMRSGHVDQKWFSDHLGPLRRFLRKNCGRPWNKVFAEICEASDGRSLTGWHLREHVAFEVAQARDLERRYSRFFVDAKGFLREGKPWRRKAAVPKGDPNVVRVDDDLRYERIHGVWYAMERGPRFETSCWYKEAGCYVRALCDPDDPRRWKKRQLGKRELRRLGLRGGSVES